MNTIKKKKKKRYKIFPQNQQYLHRKYLGNTMTFLRTELISLFWKRTALNSTVKSKIGP